MAVRPFLAPAVGSPGCYAGGQCCNAAAMVLFSAAKTLSLIVLPVFSSSKAALRPGVTIARNSGA